MRRDMDLVREILMQLADAAGPLDASAFVDEAHPRELVAYHFQIMDEGGLIVASLLASASSPYTSAQAVRLTWTGNEFLDSVRSPEVWRRAKLAVAKATGAASLAVIQAAAQKICESLVTGALQIP